jgi:hypothetical protein
MISAGANKFRMWKKSFLGCPSKEGLNVPKLGESRGGEDGLGVGCRRALLCAFWLNWLLGRTSPGIGGAQVGAGRAAWWLSVQALASPSACLSITAPPPTTPAQVLPKQLG